MMSFIHCFAQKSKISYRIDLNPTERAHDKEKTLNLAAQNSPKYAILDRKTKNVPPLQMPSPVGRGTIITLQT